MKSNSLISVLFFLCFGGCDGQQGIEKVKTVSKEAEDALDPHDMQLKWVSTVDPKGDVERIQQQDVLKLLFYLAQDMEQDEQGQLRALRLGLRATGKSLAELADAFPKELERLRILSATHSTCI